MRKEWIERYVVSLTQDTVLKRDDVIDKLADAGKHNYSISAKAA